MIVVVVATDDRLRASLITPDNAELRLRLHCRVEVAFSALGWHIFFDFVHVPNFFMELAHREGLASSNDGSAPQVC